VKSEKAKVKSVPNLSREAKTLKRAQHLQEFERVGGILNIEYRTPNIEYRMPK